MTTPVIAALKEKRRALSGRIEGLQREIREAVQQMDAIDSALRVFDPSIDVGALRDRPVGPHSASFRGEMVRLVLEALREHGKAMNVHDVTLRVMAGRGLDVTDKGLLATMTRRVSQCLRSTARSGTVKCLSAQTGKFSLWVIGHWVPEPSNDLLRISDGEEAQRD